MTRDPHTDPHPGDTVLKIAVLLVGLFTIFVGVVGILVPESGMTVRRWYYATPGRFYSAGAIRLAMGLVLLLAASRARWSGILRVLGAVMCLQALTATLFGIERARAIMEWEATQGTPLLRAGAALALVAGGFIAFAAATKQAE